MTLADAGFGARPVWGVIMEVPTVSPLWNKDIQRAEGDGSGGPVAGTHVILDTVSAQRTRFVDVGAQAPIDASKTYVYRYRLNRVGATAGSWSDWSKEREPTDLTGQVSPSGLQYALGDVGTQAGEGPQNLLGTDAGPEQEFTGVYNYLLREPIENLSLEVGDTLSLEGQAKTDGTAGAKARFLVIFFDSGGSVLATHGVNPQTSDGTTTYETLTTENFEVPTGAVEIRVRADDAPNDGSTYFARRVMLNRGPIAESFNEPPFRWAREDSADIVFNSTGYGSTGFTIQQKTSLIGQLWQEGSTSSLNFRSYDPSTGDNVVTLEWDAATFINGGETISIPGGKTTDADPETTYHLYYDSEDVRSVTTKNSDNVSDWPHMKLSELTSSAEGSTAGSTGEVSGPPTEPL